MSSAHLGSAVIRKLLLSALTFTLIAIVGCEASDRIIYRDRAPFNAPPDTASGFLGYYTPEVKQTTCGNCHAGYQARWRTSKHAEAYAAVTSVANAPETCYGCHTVNGKGNQLTPVAAGYDVVRDPAYHDVQCESCHGPGLNHVVGVGQGNVVRPLARIGVSGSGNCADCHSGNHQPFAEEWAASGHSDLNTYMAGRDSCSGCHDGRKALERWGVEANYVERDSATAYQSTTCAVCHNPHGSDNPSQLRFPVTSFDPEQNLCMKCHLRRAEPYEGSTSPHAPQGAVLLGFAGWRPPGFSYDTARIYGSHATTKNPKLCAGCHATKFTVTDPATGNLEFNATGHLMRPAPCLDGTGKPTGDKTCEYTATARSWASCTAAGCHANASVAATLFNNSRNSMQFFTDQLWDNLDNDGSLDAAPTDGGLLAQIKATMPTEFSSSDGQVTPAEGAEFNAKLCGQYNSSNSDNSKGVHNPFLCEALLIATIDFIKTYYGLGAPGPGGTALQEGPMTTTHKQGMHVVRTAAPR